MKRFEHACSHETNFGCLIIATNNLTKSNKKQINKIINKFLDEKEEEYRITSFCYNAYDDDWYDESRICYDEYDLEPGIDKVIHDVYCSDDMMVDWYDDTFCGDFHDSSITLAAGEIYLIKRKYEMAKKILAMAKRRNWDAEYPYAIVCFKMGLIDEAIKHFKLAATKQEVPDACLILIKLLVLDSDEVNLYNNIYKELKSSLRDSKTGRSKPLDTFSVGMSYIFLTKGDYNHEYVDVSVSYLTRAVSNDHVEAMSSLGRIYYEMKKYDLAEEMLKKAISKDSIGAKMMLEKMFADPEYELSQKNKN